MTIHNENNSNVYNSALIAACGDVEQIRNISDARRGHIVRQHFDRMGGEYDASVARNMRLNSDAYIDGFLGKFSES